jgi:hypothetical protein
VRHFELHSLVSPLTISATLLRRPLLGKGTAIRGLHQLC